jgi:hypothetical protein
LLPNQIRESATMLVSGLDIQSIGIIFSLILLVIDIGLLAAAIRRFNRAKLIINL